MYTLSIANQKGGVGKTTIAVSLAAGLTIRGLSVLLIDLDAQGNATRWTLPEHSDDEIDLTEVLIENASLGEVIQQSPMGFDVAPSSQLMTEVPIAFARRPENDRGLPVLRAKIEELSEPRSDERYDYILLDCPPAMGSLVLGALTASDGVVIPIEVEAMSLQGLNSFIQAVRDVKTSGANTELKLVGIVANNLDVRRNQTTEGLDELESHLGDLLFETRIRQRTSISEASAFSESVFEYEPGSYSARILGRLTDEVLRRIEKNSNS